MATERPGRYQQQTAIAGTINAVASDITLGVDYSNGATHWAGSDIGSKAEKRATGGLLFTDPAHDMQKLGSKTISGAPITTYYYNKKNKPAAHGGTTFMKKTDDFVKAAGEPRY